MSKAIWALAASALLFTAGGCKKKEEAAVAAVEQAISAEKWDLSVPNGLLPYVPEESPYVYATIRQENMETRIKNSMAVIDYEELKKMKFPAEAGGETLQNFVNAWLDVFLPIMNDYDNVAPEYGLPPKYRMDNVAYLMGDMIVSKSTVADGQKFELKAMAMLDTVIKSLGNDVTLPITERKVGNDVFKVISLKAYLDGSKGECVLCDDNKKTLLPTNIVLHFGKNIVTTAFLHENMDDASLSKLLAVAEKPLTKEFLSKYAGNTADIQYLDIPKAYKMLTAGAYKPLLSELLDGELSPACEIEIGEILADYPALTCRQMAAEKSTTAHCVLQMSDKEMLKKLQALHMNATELDSTKAAFSMGLNIDLSGALALLGEIQTRMTNKAYECEVLKEIPKELGEMTRTFADPQMKMFTNGLGAVQMVLNNLSVANGTVAVADMDAAVALSGSSIGTLMPIVSGLAAAAPELGNLLGLQKDVVKEIDLTSMIEQPLKLKAIYKDTALVVGTPNQDVQAIASKPQTKSNRFFNMVYGEKLIKLLKDMSGEAGDMSISTKGTFIFDAGTHEEGLDVNVVIQQ